jgi:hypothetical protein
MPSNPESFLFLGAAVLLLLIAHGARAARWAFLFPRAYVRGRLTLLVGLGLGYAVNALIPLRIGELVRGAVVAQLKQVRFSFVMATILAERTSDLAILALLLAGTAALASDSGAALATAAWFGFTASVLAGLAVLLRRSAALRRLTWRAAGLFNDRIRLGLVDFTWAAAEMLVGGPILRWRFLVATVIMWALYLAAYACFGRAIGAPVWDVMASVIQQPLGSLALGAGPVGAVAGQNALYVFVLTPILLILGYGLLMRSHVFAGAAEFLLRHGKSGRGATRVHRERFSAETGYQSFLGAHFSGESNAVSGFGMEAVDDCVVHRFLPGGSDAVTALIETDQKLSIRKFAVGEAARKLEVQANWLVRHRHPDLPLVEVAAVRRGSRVFSYDMPVVTPANDFYDVIHSSGPQRNRARLEQVIDCAIALHRRTAAGEADPAAVAAYLQSKATANSESILAFARGAIGADVYRLNDELYDLAEWQVFADRAWLAAQVRSREIATIHGDLTIENVIIAPDHPFGLYIIDPNPENIFDTPLLDWAKLMQSLHLGYETLNRGIQCTQDGASLRLAAARSQAYAELHGDLEARIVAELGEDGLREVYFHEIVHYLRLTTYKIRQSRTRGLGFFACTSLLLRQYRERWT